MLLDVSKALVAPGNEIPFSGEISLPDTEVLGEAVSYPAAALTGVYSSVGNAIVLRGEIKFSAAARCARCLQPGENAYVTSFDASFILEEDPENPDLYVYDGAWIDPMQMAADAALLALPMQLLCRDDCRGLCPVCGADRNETPCACQAEGQTSLSALKQLLAEKQTVQNEREV